MPRRRPTWPSSTRGWPGGSSRKGALGRRVGLVDRSVTRWVRIVGVAPDLQFEEFGEDTAQSPFNVFIPYASRPYRTMALFVRTRTTPRAQAEAVRRVFREVDPGLATWDVRSMEEVRAYTTFEQRFFGKLMGAFAGQALLLACLGVYGVLAYGVSRRTHEIGVRLALGARPLDVIRLVVRQGAKMAAAGVAAGLLLAVALGRLDPGDPLRSELLGAAAALRDRGAPRGRGPAGQPPARASRRRRRSHGRAPRRVVARLAPTGVRLAPAESLECHGASQYPSPMRFLFVSIDGLIGDIAWQVVKEGHEVRYFIESEERAGDRRRLRAQGRRLRAPRGLGRRDRLRRRARPGGEGGGPAQAGQEGGGGQRLHRPAGGRPGLRPERAQGRRGRHHLPGELHLLRRRHRLREGQARPLRDQALGGGPEQQAAPLRGGGRRRQGRDPGPRGLQARLVREDPGVPAPEAHRGGRGGDRGLLQRQGVRLTPSA